MKRKLKKYLPHIVIAAVIMAVAAFVVLYVLRPGGGAPEVMLPSPVISGGEGEHQGTESSVGEQVIEVNPDTVRIALESIARAESYSRTVQVSLYSPDGRARRQQISVWVRGADTRAVVTDGREVKNILITGGELWIWYGGSKEYYHGAAGGGQSGYREIPGLEELLEPDFGKVEEASYVEYEGEPCVFLRCTTGELGLTYRLYVSAETGLVMGAETYNGDVLIYEMRSLETDISTPEDSVFTPPL